MGSPARASWWSSPTPPAGGSLALLTAADPALRDRVSVVVSLAPFADPERILCLATTGR